jgi:hypothetical protein
MHLERNTLFKNWCLQLGPILTLTLNQLSGGRFLGNFYEGYGMGQIMLALKTGEFEGIGAAPKTLLDEREKGVGWANIWKGLGLIGSEREVHGPRGLLKKPDHAGPKN